DPNGIAGTHEFPVVIGCQIAECASGDLSEVLLQHRDVALPAPDADSIDDRAGHAGTQLFVMVLGRAEPRRQAALDFRKMLFSEQHRGPMQKFSSVLERHPQDLKTQMIGRLPCCPAKGESTGSRTRVESAVEIGK